MSSATTSPEGLAGRVESPTGTWRSYATLVAASLLCALVSVALQGVEPGTNNNTFHLPILLRLYDLPQFADDAFVQSLRRFASFVYPLLANVASEANVAAVLLACHLLTRTLNILALLLLARDLLPPLPRALPLVLAVLVLPGTLYGASPLGGAGLFLTTFTHSELAQALGLFTLLAAVRGRFLLAAPLWALTFSLNAFVGAWCLLPLALLALDLFRERRAAALRPLAAAAALAVLLALPNLLWVLSFLRRQPPLGFDYVAFLREYPTGHFLIDSAKPRNVGLLGLHVTAALAGLWVLGWPRRWCIAYAGILAVFLIGVAMPFVTHSPTVLNLHLLRVDGMLVLLGTAFSAAAISTLVFSPDTPPTARTAALLVLPALFLGYWPSAMVAEGGTFFLAAGLLAAAALLFYGATLFRFGRMLLDGHNRTGPVLPSALFAATWLLLPFQRGRLVEPSWPMLLAAALATLLAAIFVLRGRSVRSLPAVAALAAVAAVHVALTDHQALARRVTNFPNDGQLIGLQPIAPEWAELTEWARRSTDPSAVFMIPPSLTAFESMARRRVWFDQKQGAAVMWSPDFHAQWRRRRDEMDALGVLSRARRYACDNGIAYIVVDSRPVEATNYVQVRPGVDGRLVVDEPAPAPAFANHLFRAYPAAPC